MHSLRLLVLLGVLMATQGRVLDQDKAPEVVASPQETKPVEVKQEVANEILETKPQLVGAVISQGQSSAAIDHVGVKEGQNQVANSANPDVQESQPQVLSVVEVTKENQEAHAPLSKVVSSPVAPAIAEEKQSTSNEIPKDQEPRKEEVITQNHPDVQGRDNKIQLVYEQPGQNQNQIPQISIQDLEKIFKYQGVQVVNGSQSLYQYPSTYNKYPSYPKVEYVSVVNTSDANVTQHIHNHTHYYPNQKKPGFPFPFLPNPFEKQEPVYVNLNQTTNSTGNVTYHTHIHEETKPFPFLPNPFTDFPKVVGLSLVLLPNPFYVNKNHNVNQSQVVSLPAGYQENGEYQYFGKFRALSEETQKQQQKQQSQQQSQQQAQKPNFYLIPNPLASQASGDGQKVDGNVVLPINLAALPLLVPAPELTQGKASPSGSISFQDLIKATNVHVSQPIKLQANNGFTQVQKEQAAIQQLILSHLSEQQKLFQKQSVAGGKRSQSAQPVVQLQEEEESSVLFAVEIPKPIYRFFKGIFGGFSN
ncbi:uncharacterized protein LOC117140463 [Drosophila mauritiana]|uniref:Uncharacterized protein LOC117140463 n=1 Tax=Drosophila mauritiana TaxID=7226 RepID=A0A6P8JRV6_DROMA|nr:uncharacterized protein LOC117140463 [Drosophila mauritiana]